MMPLFLSLGLSPIRLLEVLRLTSFDISTLYPNNPFTEFKDLAQYLQ